MKFKDLSITIHTNKVKERNVDDQIWNFSYYSDNDIINIRRFCRHLNIPKEKCPAFQNV